MIRMKNIWAFLVLLVVPFVILACRSPHNPSVICSVVIGKDNIVKVEGRACLPQAAPRQLEKIGWTKDCEVWILCWAETDRAVLSAVSNAVVTAGYAGVKVLMK